MVLSLAQQALVSVVLVVCAFVVMPRMFGGGGRSLREGKASPGRHDAHQHRPGGPERILQPHVHPQSPEGKTYQSIQQMRNTMEKELKTERSRGSGKDFALTLMPLYALGVGAFALYKFLKMKSQEESLLKKENATEEKTKETERQLLELEQHLSQTETMLNSLLNQLDPLSSCINTLASEQKDEIMEQLESIRKLMKESGLDKSAVKPQDISHTCQEKIEDLIHSFSKHPEAAAHEGGDEGLFEDTEELSGEGGHPHCPHEVCLNALGPGLNRDLSEPEAGLRRRTKNE